MALPILDGNQTATTLATTVSGSAHYPNHIITSGTVTANVTVIDNINNVPISLKATDDGFLISVIEQIPPISGTVTANLAVIDIVNNLPISLKGTDDGFLISVIDSALPAGTNRIGVVTIGGGTVTIGAGTAQIGSVTASGTVTANIGGIANSVTLPVRLNAEQYGGAPSGQDTLVVCNSSGMLLVDANSGGSSVLGFDGNAFVQIKPVSGSSVTIGNSITIGSCVTHGVTIANTSVTVNGTFYQATQPVSLATLPALVAGTAQIGSVTASISNTSVTVYPAQGTTVTNSNFTSLTSSTSLVSAVAGRKVLSVFNEGAGNLHISPNATCTTISYQVRLSSGDYWECPSGQLSLAHTAVFATAGTARITEVS